MSESGETSSGFVAAVSDREMALVNAFVGSEVLRLKDAFSAHIAHWSRGRVQYFPRFVGGLGLVSEGLSAKEETMPNNWDDIRERRRRIDRALIRGSRKRRNSWGKSKSETCGLGF